MMKYSRFQKGSALYMCRCCGQKTRDTAGDAANVRMCAECYEVAGWENAVADGYEGADEELNTAIDTAVRVRKCQKCARGRKQETA